MERYLDARRAVGETSVGPILRRKQHAHTLEQRALEPVGQMSTGPGKHSRLGGTSYQLRSPPAGPHTLPPRPTTEEDEDDENPDEPGSEPSSPSVHQCECPGRFFTFNVHFVDLKLRQSRR